MYAGDGSPEYQEFWSEIARPKASIDPTRP